jgi:DNA replication and repair protein RecF
VRITNLQLKNFRCFANLEIDLNHGLILIQGNNGSGKTTVLEALHYACYLRSFRTHAPQELMHFNEKAFFIKAQFINEGEPITACQEVQVGFSGKKRLVKLNNKVVSSYKELMDHYRVVTLTEDDLVLIKGDPQERRAFLDQLIVLHTPDFIKTSKELKGVVEQRNALFKQRSIDPDSYAIWTEQLWHCSQAVHQFRNQILGALEVQIRDLVERYFESRYAITFCYKAKKALHDSLQAFLEQNHFLYHEEVRIGHSLFGAHLDDFLIQFQDKKSKSFASRGQQKLIVLLIKIAQILMLKAQGCCVVFLLDDFMTDFDHERINHFLDILQALEVQLIVTSPLLSGYLEEQLLARGALKQSLKA